MNDDVLDNMIHADTKEQKKDLDVLKELFTLKDIESKTELNIQQIIMINQKRTLSKMLGFESLETCLNDFMILMVSHQRKGRGEFVDGFKSDREREVKAGGGGFFNSFRDRLGFK